jgi:adenosine deaminase
VEIFLDNFDQYLTLVQNDVQLKIDTLKTHLEKYGEQFIENLKNYYEDKLSKLSNRFDLMQDELNKDYELDKYLIPEEKCSQIANWLSDSANKFILFDEFESWMFW